MKWQSLIPTAQKIQAQTGIPASVTLAQAIHESGSGLNSGLATQGHNLYGIKGKGDAGSITMPTHEYVNGKLVTVDASFARYHSAGDSMEAYAKLLSSPAYAKHLKNAASVNQYVKGIAASGYATDPNYTSEILNTISSMGLHKYDGSNYSFTPLSGSGGGSTSGSSSGTNKGFIGDLFYGGIHAIMLIGLMILVVVFVMKAFPATGNAVKKGKKLVGEAVLT